ncbi:MAG: hypothetical protein OEQ53_09400, partial [Saprospiraceae bacterium]|nr:hypothetical protein [Saprospiraceae bacterium]
LNLSLNGVVQELKFGKMKVEELTVYVVYLVKSDLAPSTITQIDVTNTVLVDEFTNQRNVVHVELPDKKRKSMLFNRYHRTAKSVY